MASIINATTTAGVSVQGDNSGSLQLATNNGTTAVTIDTSQNVGIGTTSPTQRLQLNVGGATDLYTRYTNGSFTNGFFVGLSSGGLALLAVNDNFPMQFQTNGTSRMNIAAAGQITTPFQPAFRAFRSSSVSVAASGVVVFDSTSTNIGSNYNTSNGRFTAPVTGMYQFAVQLLFEGLSNGNECECSIYVNGGGVLNFGPRVKYQADYTGFNGYVSMFASISIYLNANDYVQAAQITSGARTVYGSGSGVWTVFSGFLIG